MAELTDRGEIRRLCDKYGFSLQKGYGQNFLVNPAVCPRICEAAGIDESTGVLEIGPGFGTLTRELAKRAGRVVAVELDGRLLPVLEETLAAFQNVKVVQGDVLKLDLAALLAGELSGRAKVCANLPYYITSPIIMKLLEEKLPLGSLTVMVQREAAQRIVAAPGSRDAGALSYAVHYYTQPKVEFTVGPGSFTPPPKVHSSVVTLKLRQRPLLAQQPQREKRLFRLVRAAFGQRRKTLANAAAAGLGMDKAIIQAAMEALRLDLRARPEQLALEQFIALEARLWPKDG